MTAPLMKADVRAFLDNLSANPRPPMSDELVAMMRKIPPGMMPSADLPVGELAVDRCLKMPIVGGETVGGEIDLRLFDPRANRGAGPVVVFYHGGGFVVGSIGTHAALAAEIARALDLPVISVEYRLAPEHKWPAGVDDAEASARWVAENGAILGFDVTGLILCGDSAGGNFVLTTAMALRDAPAEVPVVLTIPIYPVADEATVYPSVIAYSTGHGLDGSSMAYFGKALEWDLTSPRATPLVGELAGLPPMVLATAEFDPLRDSGRALAAKAILAGVDVHYYEARGTIHGFATYRLTLESARADLAAIMDAAKLMLLRDDSQIWAPKHA